MKTAKLWFVVALLTSIVFVACTYMRNVARQSDYAERQRREPSLQNLKYLLDTETHYVSGRTSGPRGEHNGKAVAVAAYAHAFGRMELVDIMHNAGIGTHYGLNLPRAHKKAYQLVVLKDQNGNGQFDTNEVVGERTVTQAELLKAQGVLRNINIEVSPPKSSFLSKPVPVRKSKKLPQSLFFPSGAIRELSDPIFDPEMAATGMYEPAAFLEKAPVMFYALEEDLGMKVPVVFVHGLGGTARQFAPLLERLDRKRFKPWFFYYPSGAPLTQLAKLFYGIYLSGDTANRDLRVPTVIVAHSMGGLIVREALNLLESQPKENSPIHFVSVGAPFAGHPSAAAGEENGFIVVPSWRSLNPGSAFIAQLYRHSLPEYVTYKLVYGFRNDELFSFGPNSDGSVPLSSQLRPEAQAESQLQRGFDATHTGVLRNEAVLDFIAKDIHRFHIDFPPDHIEWIFKGGFVVPESGVQEPMIKRSIEIQGQYLRALALEWIKPLDALQRQFVEAASGRRLPQSAFEIEWLKFMKENPNPTAKALP